MTRIRIWWSVLMALIAWSFPSQALDLLPVQSDWRYLKGTAEASSPDVTAWRQLGFNDAGWLTGQSTFWYGDVFNGTQITDMQNSYSSLFFRKKFTVVNPGDIQDLILHAQCDDGFIAWINGREVARYNVPAGDLPYNSFALTAANPDPAVFADYALADPKTTLVAGDNVLAVQVFNVTLGSSDIVWDAALQATVDESAPVIVHQYPTAGAAVRELLSVEVEFSEAVTGVDASDLLINGVAATNVSSVTPAQYLFTFPKVAPGLVTIGFTKGHGITDLAGTPHPFGGGSWNYTVDPDLRPPGLEISEFMADNQKGIRDEDGDRTDWIEIHNGAAETQPLTGWSLTDDAANLTKWQFPALTLAPNSYLLVYASGKDRTNATAPLHTNFKLGSSGGYLALVSPGGEVVSDFGPSYPAQRADVSFGRATGASNVTGYFVKPTPGVANTTSGTGFAPDVLFSASGRTFLADFQLVLSLSGTNAGAVIHYTTNDTLPDESSPPYTGPITISTSTRVRARAFATGVLPGSPHGETFLRLASNATPFTSDLPVIVLHDFGAGRPPDSGSLGAHMEVFEPVNGVTSLTNPPVFTSRVSLGARGSSTLGNAKVNMSLEIHDEFDASFDYSLLGLPAESDWVLYGPDGFEPVLIHNPFMHQLSRDIGRYSPRTRFVELYMITSSATAQVTSTTYFGIYALEEKIKRGKDRVDIDAVLPQFTKAPQITGGYMMKIDRSGPGEGGFYAANQGIIYVDPKEREITLPEWSAQRQYLQSYMDSFGSALYGASWTNPTNGYAAYINPDSWIDHHLLNILAFNVDALRLSANFYKPRGGRLEFGPLWDFDRALGSTDGRDFNPRIWCNTPDQGTDFFNETTQAWWGRLFRDLEFFQRYIDRYQELRRNQFSTTNLWRLTDDLVGQIRLAQPRERTKWGGNYRTATGGGGGTYATEVQWMKNWLSNRVAFMDSQFVSPVVFLTAGGRFTNSTEVSLRLPTAGTTYYTLDGSDPRLPGGGISPRAIAYNGSPIPLTDNARIVARVQNPAQVSRTGGINPPLASKWSGPVADTFYNVVPPLLVTEIMFRPAAPPAGSTNSAGDFEFIELKNTSSHSLNLGGFTIAGAVSFTFPTNGPVPKLGPGGRAVIVRNRAAFLTRYPAAPGIAGEYAGQLSNGSEHIRLTGPLQEPVCDFEYEDDWAPLADGFGFSLVLQDETVTPDQLGEAARWRLSAKVGGSPGIPESLPVSVQPILVNEVLANTDAPLLDSVELVHAGNTAQDISGWWLTDDYRTPKKFRLPAGTLLNPRGYVVFDENQFRLGGNGNTGFSFSAQGDDVHLFSADANGELTGYHNGLSFGASFRGVSFGRLVTSDGREHFTAQSQRSLGTANIGPLSGPVAITELHYHPPSDGPANNTEDEFVELRNVSAGPVALFDPAHATNRWHLRGAVEFEFPTDVILPVGGFALVVGFDPATDPGQLAEFRSRFGPPAAVPVVGPWRGTLNNAGESVRLLAPDAPVTAPAANAGDVPYVLIDELDYLPAAPWPPEADGTGSSLQRIASRQYGDEPANWFAAAPTAGQPNLASDFLGADSDGDGLPDDWETAQGLDANSAVGNDGAAGDPDGDGFTNAQEFIAGTNAKDPASQLQLHTDVDNGLKLSFQGQPGRRYTIRSLSALGDGTWQTVKTFPARDTATNLEFADPAADGTRFYQLSTP
ncbi:MAG TPA: lamin tail domain-containing protein [Candidatus Limnocylindria bacterium]|nr:lamin tail domain-containing protein [Candidatus Limnocylindria bacterium]